MVGYVIAFGVGAIVTLFVIAWGWSLVERSEDSVVSLVEEAFAIGFEQARKDSLQMIEKPMIQDQPRVHNWLKSNLEKLKPSRNIYTA